MRLLLPLCLVSISTALAWPATADARAYKPVVLSYGSSSLQKVTVYPGTAPNSPLVVLIHGGGYRSTAHDAVQLGPDALQLVHAGDAAFVVNYRSDTGGVTIGDEVADIVAGTQLAEADAADYDANPANVTLLGGSSGGNLVANAAEAMSVQKVITLSGPFDFAQGIPYWESVGGKEGSLHVKNEIVALGCSKVKHQAVCPTGVEAQWSPDLHVQSNATQWLILNETNEVDGTPTFQADLMTQALTAAGDGVTEDVMPGNAHSFAYWPTALATIEAFVR